MKILYLNTADEIVRLGIITEDSSNYLEFKQNNNLVEILDDRIEAFLMKHRLFFKDLTHLAVFKGPGSFTSLRIGIVTANTASSILGIPLIEIAEKEEKKLEKNIKNKIKKRDFKKQILPFYGKEPNITKPKE